MVIDMIMGDERYISIDPRAYLNSRNSTLGKFRKIAKLAATSDLIFGTDCVNAWSAVVDEYIGLCITGMKQQDALRSEALARGDGKAHKKAINTLKRVDAKRRKFLRYKEMLTSEKTKEDQP